MDITPLIKQGQQVIDGYGSGFFRIAGKVWRGPVLVTPEETFPLTYHPEDRRDEGSAVLDYEKILRCAQNDRNMEILLVGMGKAMQPLDPAIRQQFRDKGIIVEMMGTAAACRTYNVLMPEGRSVAAALIPISG